MSTFAPLFPRNLNRITSSWRQGKERNERTLTPTAPRAALPAELIETKPPVAEPDGA